VSTWKVSVLVAIAASISACARVFVAEPTDLSFLGSNKRNLSVVLNVTETLKNAEWLDKTPIGWETPNYKLGKALIANSELVLRALFSEVHVLEQGKPQPASVSLLVTPRMVSVKQNRPLWIHQDTTINLVYEWSMQDKNGNVIWLTTIVGEGTTPLASNPAERVDLLMKDLFKKSFDEMSASIEIDRFTASQRFR